MLFWIAIYCLHADRCYVSKDLPDSVHKYPTEAACRAEIGVGKEIKRNTDCYAVKDVSCINGGSICTFTPADPVAADKLKSMVVIPK